MKKSHLYLLVLALIIIVSVVLITTSGGKAKTNLIAFDGQYVPQALLAQLNIPDNVSAAVGSGFATNYPRNVSGSMLQIGGKPEVLYIGANFCPFCALERWGMVIALMRFGNFTGLQYMTSSPTDIGPSTPTFTFTNATYSSNYIVFVARETLGNILVNGSYPVLQQLNASQLAIGQRYNLQGSIPFIDFANKSIQVGANYNDPTVLANRNWSTIASLLRNASSVQAQALVGTANLFTAQVCKIDGNQPASVCGKSYIKSIVGQLR